MAETMRATGSHTMRLLYYIEIGQPHVRGCPGLTCSDRCLSSPSRWDSSSLSHEAVHCNHCMGSKSTKGDTEVIIIANVCAC